MTSNLEIVDLGEAESLIEIGMPENSVEPVEKYLSSTAPYVEFAEN